VDALAALAAAAAAAGLLWSVRERRAAAGDPLTPALAAGGLLTALLLAVDHGSVLSGGFGAGAGPARAAVPGVGVLLGVALLSALAGSLLLGAQRFAGGAEGTRGAAVGLLWAAVLAAAVGVAFALVSLAPWAGESPASGATALLGLAAAAAALATALLEARRPSSTAAAVAAGRALLWTRIAAGLAVLTTLVAGADGFLRQGTYGTATTLASDSAALLGLAALEPTLLASTRRLVFLASLLGVILSGG
jgi:hypothetical protein